MATTPDTSVAARAKYEPVIGLEVHVQLLTVSKIFCSCSTRFGDPPNTNVCPVCLGLPGALPVLNRKAVEFAVLAAMALGCRINQTSIFARKNYFYPDLPKGYQISQYDKPLAEFGAIDTVTAAGIKKIGITRLHLEEDAGKSLHEGFADSAETTAIDLNRSGVPLIEIVSEPHIASPNEAYEYLTRLKEIILYTGVSDCNMEEGSLRCDANVSVRPRGEKRFGTKTEIKNVNSFRFIREALEYEIDRQIGIVESGGKIAQETRLYNSSEGKTYGMRSKEQAHDYRYFPEPDLLPLVVDETWLAEIRSTLPELPEPRRRRMIADYGITDYDAQVLTSTRSFADQFEAAAKAAKNPKRVANLVQGELMGRLKAKGLEIEQSPISMKGVALSADLVESGMISGKMLKDLYDLSFERSQDFGAVYEKEKPQQITDSSAIEKIIEEIIAANPKQVEQYRAGKKTVIGFFAGQVMKASKGQANPQMVNELLAKEARELKSMFKKILIANRGEIAVRVIRACRELGITSVAVYSDVDRASLHVRKADEAYHIGAPAAAESYLNFAMILDVAKRSGADAIHPGYGFLSENAKFAEACVDAGIKFIGPTAASMEMMGSKTRARQEMEKAGVPFVPGTSRGLESAEQAEQVAAKIGYPVMLKAAAGGGGKGMRLVHARNQLKSALDAAQSEAERAFGDREVYIEKAIINPRHIEMQVLGDEHGNTVYLGERECSIQRRHQKVLEESPSPIVDPDMRQHMGEVAVRVAKAAGYTNAGTVEFLVDQDKNFYFLEMNTRLQVEHPVTELVTGLDLVHLQIRIAAGAKLPFRQEDVRIRGHAMECRIYAEDPDNNYFPSPGKITLLLSPSGPGIRQDSGMYEGWTVPIDYDPLLAKLIGYATNRTQAISRLTRALHEYFVGGIKTNISLFRRILTDADFQAGKLDTGYLDRLLKSKPPEVRGGHPEVAAIAAGIFAALDSASALASNGKGSATSGNGGDAAVASGWKRAARVESLR